MARIVGHDGVVAKGRYSQRNQPTAKKQKSIQKV